MKDFVSKINGTGVFFVTQNWYLSRRETSPTLVCISPNRMPGKRKSHKGRNLSLPTMITSPLLSLTGT
jgi:hypothetical protein